MHGPQVRLGGPASLTGGHEQQVNVRAPALDERLEVLVQRRPLVRVGDLDLGGLLHDLGVGVDAVKERLHHADSLLRKGLLGGGLRPRG